MLAALGLMVHERRPKPICRRKKKLRRRKFLPGRYFAAFDMGSGVKDKQYPPERFAEVWSEKVRNDLSVVLLGGRGEEWEVFKHSKKLHRGM